MENQKLEKEVYSVEDLMQMTGLTKDTCYKIIRQVRHFRDSLGISGHIHRKDWEYYINRFEKKDSANTSNPGTAYWDTLSDISLLIIANI